jgi:small subunit ribosomal protein S16
LSVHIRLRRMGKKKRPFYRIVAADSRRARDGRFLEVLGTYNPIEQPAVINVKEDLSYWLNNGAEPSDTVGTLLTQIGFTQKFHKAQAGVDVTEMALKATITERKKKTRKAKKAIAARAQAVEAEAAAKVADAAAKAAEAAAGEQKTEG